MIPGIVVLFDDDVSIRENISSSTEILKLKYPNQGSTNITLAVETAINLIISHFDKNKKDIHYILTFLSDGHHNAGPILDSTKINYMRLELNKRRIQLSVIIVGISSSDTSLGMKVKTGLETVTITHWKVYIMHVL